MKTNSITLVFYDSLVAKTNYRNTAAFQSCFSFSLIPPWRELESLEMCGFSYSANLEEKELRKQKNESFMTLGLVAGTSFDKIRIFIAYVVEIIIRVILGIISKFRL